MFPTGFFPAGVFPSGFFAPVSGDTGGGSASPPDAFLPAHLRTPHGRVRVGPGVKTH